MREYIELGPVPCDEDCAQVGSENFRGKAKIESNAYIHQLERMFGAPPEGARLGVKWFPHDFGSYCEVVCYYDDSTPESVEYAYNVENNCPTNWDELAKQELIDNS